ncbi:winged helix-turn-helix domain-containing protein [Streptomyces sp. NPDC048383]|uniref:winged helix-turn-helix domain-containing protein n=1 Tax=Streptomyces sp. NPDC048383 TaxID=3155386 RepID=UPI0034494A3E
MYKVVKEVLPMTFSTLHPPLDVGVCCTMSRPDRPSREGEAVGEPSGQPEYQRVMEDLRRQIAEGDLKVGDPIPSTAKLGSQYGVSSTVVRRAVTELTAEGLLYGKAGKGVFVQAQPDPLERLPTSAELTATVRNLEAKLEAMASRLEALERGRED